MLNHGIIQLGPHCSHTLLLGLEHVKTQLTIAHAMGIQGVVFAITSCYGVPDDMTKMKYDDVVEKLKAIVTQVGIKALEYIPVSTLMMVILDLI